MPTVPRVWVRRFWIRSTPFDLMLRYGFIPEAQLEGRVSIVMADPTDILKLDEIETQLEELLAETRRAAAEEGAEVILTGILPTLAALMKSAKECEKELTAKVIWSLAFVEDNRHVIMNESALAVVEGKPLVNSVNGEEASLQSVLPLVKERGAAVIGLTMAGVIQ